MDQEQQNVRSIVARGGNALEYNYILLFCWYSFIFNYSYCFDNDNIMKPIMITLMYLTFGGDIKLDTFEINDDCSGWFHNNVKVVENKKRTLFSNHVYHEYKGKKVIGYVCGGDEPKWNIDHYQIILLSN